MTHTPTTAISVRTDLIKQIAREYNTLDYLSKLMDLLSRLCPGETFSDYSKIQLHSKINEILITQHRGEQQLKYTLCKQFFNKNVIAAFEMRVNRSRADFLTVNGVSKSFEIKSSLDNLGKLNKQSGDYIKVFDYNYLVIDSRHLTRAEQIVPSSFGIWTFNGIKKKVYRDAKPNSCIDPEMQLQLLTKRELQVEFKDQGGERRQILKDYNAFEINNFFKRILKTRYQNRWNFIVSHRDLILPIDLQFFFNTNIKPEYVYYH